MRLFMWRSPRNPLIRNFAASALNINCGSKRYTADAECNHADFPEGLGCAGQKARRAAYGQEAQYSSTAPQSRRLIAAIRLY